MELAQYCSVLKNDTQKSEGLENDHGAQQKSIDLENHAQKIMFLENYHPRRSLAQLGRVLEN